jgi:hypothetical protein
MGYMVNRLAGMIEGGKVASGWPFQNTLTVDSIDPNADYDNLPDAVTGASAGDAILINSETITLTSALSIDKKLFIASTAPRGTKITLATSNTSTISVTAGGAGTIFFGLEIENTATGTNAACIATNQNCEIIDCKLTKTGGATNGYGIWIFTNAITVSFTDSEISVSGPTSGYGVKIDSGSTVRLRGGAISGNTDDIIVNHASAMAELIDPVLENDDLNIASGSASGGYYRGSDGLWVPLKFMGVRVYHSSTTTLSNSTITTINFNSERYDTDGFHDTVTNNSRLTATIDGYYIIAGNLTYDFHATGIRSNFILLNGTTYIAADSRRAPVQAGETSQINTGTIYFLNAGDYVEMQGFQNSGGNLNVQANTDYSPVFMMHRMAQ